MEMLIDFPGDDRVDAHFDAMTVSTDQPHRDGSVAFAPTPYDTFLASLGTCAGIYVLGFCRQRNLPTDGIRLIERIQFNPTTHLADVLDLEIQVPAEFPAKYYDALIRSADQCMVKQQIERPPVFHINTRVV